MVEENGHPTNRYQPGLASAPHLKWPSYTHVQHKQTIPCVKISSNGTVNFSLYNDLKMCKQI